MVSRPHFRTQANTFRAPSSFWMAEPLWRPGGLMAGYSTVRAYRSRSPPTYRLRPLIVPTNDLLVEHLSDSPVTFDGWVEAIAPKQAPVGFEGAEQIDRGAEAELSRDLQNASINVANSVLCGRAAVCVRAADGCERRDHHIDIPLPGDGDHRSQVACNA